MGKLLTVIAVVALVSAPLAAQDYSRYEVFGGYQLLHETGLNMHGFNAAIEMNFSPVFGIAGEFGYGKGSMSFLDATADNTMYTFMAGPRFSYRQERFRIFGHALFGNNYSSQRGSISGNELYDVSWLNFAMAFGTGFDISLNERIAIRPGQIDWLRLRSSTLIINDVTIPAFWGNQIRYTAGVVFKFGTQQ